MKRRLQIGGALVVALGIAIAYFTDGLPGLGVGTGDGDGDNRDIRTQVPDVSNTPTDADSSAVAGDVVHVVIESEGFSLKTLADDAPSYEPIELDAVVELAKQAKGDASGIRVVITSRESARPSPENLLKRKLIEAGLEEREIDGYSRLKIEAGKS